MAVFSLTQAEASIVAAAAASEVANTKGSVLEDIDAEGLCCLHQELAPYVRLIGELRDGSTTNPEMAARLMEKSVRDAQESINYEETWLPKIRAGERGANLPGKSAEESEAAILEFTAEVKADQAVARSVLNKLSLAPA